MGPALDLLRAPRTAFTAAFLAGAAAMDKLIAENPDFAPIIVDLKRDPFAIEGIAVGVIRPSI